MSSSTLALVFLGTGVLFVVFAIPLILGRVRRNLFYGFRTRKTLASDEVWYPANRYAGRGLALVGGLEVVTGLVLALQSERLGVTSVAVWGLGVLLVSLVVTVAAGFRYVRRL